MRFLERIINYIKETRTEVKYVNWPSRQTTLRYTLMVIGISAGIAIFLGSFDILFTYLVNLTTF